LREVAVATFRSRSASCLGDTMVKITEGYANKIEVPPGTNPKSGIQVFDQ